MANSSIPEGLANQVSSESLDTFLLNLSATSDLEDLAMDQPLEEDQGSSKSRHSNVKQPSTLPCASTTESSNHENIISDSLATNNTIGVNGMATTTNASARKTAAADADPVQPPSSTTTANAVCAARAISGTVPEFLYQLFQMLTDNNREVIEWADGKIKVHSPTRLQNEILHNYFRHSKFASFQRQLNYFGFRKLAGKGKMSPCSYVNESIGDDLNRLMLIKRKTGPAGAKDGRKTRKHPISTSSRSQTDNGESRVSQSGRIRRRSSRTTSGGMPPPPALPDKSSASMLARHAVGKGVRHNVISSATRNQHVATPSQTSPSSTMPQPPTSNSSINQSLSELESNYRSSLGNTAATVEGSNDEFFGGFLSRDSSLVDLAMIPQAGDNDGDAGAVTFDFVDFPYPEIDPLTCLNDGEERKTYD